MREPLTSATDVSAPQEQELPARRVPAKQQSWIWHRTSMAQASAEAVAIFTAGRIVALLPVAIWPGPLVALAPVIWLGLMFLAPVWAASRVTSTRREKMSRRFWRLGPRLAVYCAVATGALAVITRTTGSLGDFARGEAILLFVLAVYFTIAVVCTRLSFGGFLRFTMPGGDGRVTL